MASSASGHASSLQQFDIVITITSEEILTLALLLSTLLTLTLTLALALATMVSDGILKSKIIRAK
jgi:hypothetical protein